MPRPAGIKLTLWLMLLNMALGIIAGLLNHPAQRPMHVFSAAQMALILHLISAVFYIFASVVLWRYWLGRFWARRMIFVDCAIHLYSLIHLKAAWNFSRFNAALIVYGALLALYLLWYLNTPQLRAWSFRTPLVR